MSGVSAGAILSAHGLRPLFLVIFVAQRALVVHSEQTTRGGAPHDHLQIHNIGTCVVLSTV